MKDSFSGVGIVLLFALIAAPAATVSAQKMGGDDGWQPPGPPATWPAQENHGYGDGIEAAWTDLAGHLRPKPSRHTIYQHPPSVKPGAGRYEYRLGFRKGYDVVYDHAHSATR
ncbi:MAG: hypothetical protein ACLGXA_22315 [Acidobacteriota bacterium]